MSWFKSFGKKRGIVSVEVMASGLGIVVKGREQNNESLDMVTMIESDAKVDQLTQLTEFVVKHNLSDMPCYVVLPNTDYQLLLVEAPDVEDNELRSAMRWKVKDLLSMPLEKAVLDVFPMPADGNRTGKKMVYVVASNLDHIQKCINLINESGLALESIEIEEMALRNLSLLKSADEESRGVAMVRVVEGGGSVSLYRAGNLYLSRQFTLNYSGGLLDDLPGDVLALEVQRSLDYYERQMGLAPPSGLYIFGENITEDKVTTDIKRSLTVPTQYFDIHNELNSKEDIDEGLLHLCVAAVGGVLREGIVQ